MFDWFFAPREIKLPELPKYEDMWKTHTVPVETSFPFEKLKVTAGTDGSVRIEVNELTFTIPPALRHAFLDKIEKAVDMADIADPENE